MGWDIWGLRLLNEVKVVLLTIFFVVGHLGVKVVVLVKGVEDAWLDSGRIQM